MRKLGLLILLLQVVTVVSAQSYRLSGKITDNETGESIPHSSVLIRSVNKGSTSGADGTFVLPGLARGAHRIEAVMMGYETASLNVTIDGNISGIDIRLNKSSLPIDEVVVTATRTERLLADVPIAIQVISARAIEKMQLPTFRDLLEYELPGVEFTNNGGHSNINMLGFGGKYVLFLLDGERMAGETFDNIDYNRIDMDNIERVEIVKGAASSLYGSNAVGGVINIITRKPEHPFQAQVSGRYGSYDALNGNMTLSSRQSWGSVSLTAGYKRMSPYLLVDRERMKGTYSDGTVVERAISQTYVAGYEDYQFSPRVILNLTNKLTLDMKGSYYFKERHSGGRDGDKVKDNYYDYTGGLKLNYAITENQNLSLSGKYDRYDKYKFYELLNEREKNYDNSQWQVGGLYDISIRDKHSIVIGAEYFSDELWADKFEIEPGQYEKKDARTWAVFTQQEWRLFRPLTLVVGGRYDHHSQFNGHFTPRLGLMYRPWEKVTLRGGYSGGFRAPTLKELYTDWYHEYGSGFQLIGNKEMKPESSRNFNLSAEFRAGRTVVTAIAQHSDIANMIDAVTIHKDTVQYQNVGNVRQLSTELAVTHSLRKDLVLKASYAYVRNNRGKNSTIRPHTATLRVDYTASFIHKKYSPVFSLSGKYFGGMDKYESFAAVDDEAVETETSETLPIVHYDGYMIWRLSIDIPLPYRLSVNAGVNNLFGYKPKFSTFYSSITPGTTFYIGIRWRLK